MSITYEDALSTLEAMFGAPWTRETLDTVLRHEKGHMENTCERILNHGDKDPQILVDRLQSGEPDPQQAIDEALALQLSAQEQGGGRGGGSRPAPATSGKKKAQAAAGQKGRGVPTSLPDDFLRVPGFKIPANAGASAAATPMDDESLARMLQDELFSEELARNPDFAHLARGRGGGRSAPAQRRSNATAPPPNPFEGVNVMEKLSEMGDNTRRRLQIMARNFELKLNANKAPVGGGGGTGIPENTSSAAERRGLLDDDDDMEQIEFEMHKKRA
ncbi:unnamed protein product [Cylindrotheca closterium]|uniref:CUE domain-containing protein n=1 Tax=Cylindrotheca closterium TaxID=2856 RepID=A0AAD2FI28_9STRA|nr:unnamed protein product [Cylindrotheca closterium]